MRIRITIEYDTDETLDYERKAWTDGDVGLPDFLALAAPTDYDTGDPNILVRFEAIVT